AGWSTTWAGASRWRAQWDRGRASGSSCRGREEASPQPDQQFPSAHLHVRITEARGEPGRAQRDALAVVIHLGPRGQSRDAHARDAVEERVRAGGLGQRLDVRIRLIDGTQLARIVAEAQEPRVQQAAIHVLDVERVEALWPERPRARGLDDDAPARARVELPPALRAPRDNAGRILPRGAFDLRRLAGSEAAASRVARARVERGPEQRVEMLRVIVFESGLPA